jgi:hypothetical protein
MVKETKASNNSQELVAQSEHDPSVCSGIFARIASMICWPTFGENFIGAQAYPRALSTVKEYLMQKSLT